MPVRQRMVTAAVVAACWLCSAGLLLAYPLLDGPTGLFRTGAPTATVVAYLLVLTAQAGALVGWRSAPTATFVAVVALAVPGAWLSRTVGTDLSGLTVIVAAYALCVGRRLREIAPALGGGAVVLVVARLVLGAAESVGPEPAHPTERYLLPVLQVALSLGLPLLTAVFVTGRREVAAARLESVRSEAREREAQLETATARERTAMARELHDVAAHHLSGMAVMTGAIERMVDTDPALAKESLREVRKETTLLLGNLRQLVGLLRQPGADQGPAVSLDGVGALVERARAGGADVELVVHEGAPGLVARHDLGPIAQLAMYRMVQESLANSAIHAPGAPCRVVLDDRDPEAVVATVDSAPSGVGPMPSRRAGLGLVGMRERADLTGSTLTYGRTGDGGWQVSLRTPRESPDQPLEE